MKITITLISFDESAAQIQLGLLIGFFGRLTWVGNIKKRFVRRHSLCIVPCILFRFETSGLQRQYYRIRREFYTQCIIKITRSVILKI